MLGESTAVGGVALTPVREIECGLPAASSVITRVADFVPKVCGENVTLMVQFVPPARVEDAEFARLVARDL